MNKKTYIAPKFKIVEMLPIRLISSSHSFNNLGEEEDDCFELNANNRRGTWGNLWGND